MGMRLVGRCFSEPSMFRLLCIFILHLFATSLAVIIRPSLNVSVSPVRQNLLSCNIKHPIIQKPVPLQLPPLRVSADWKNSQKKAQDLLTQMKNIRNQNSAFNNYSDLARWGWTIKRQPWMVQENHPGVLKRFSGLFLAMGDLKLSIEMPPNVKILALQNQGFHHSDSSSSEAVSLILQFCFHSILCYGDGLWT